MSQISRIFVCMWLCLVYIKTANSSELCHNLAVCPGAEHEICRFSNSSNTIRVLRVGIKNESHCVKFRKRKNMPLVKQDEDDHSDENCEILNITAEYDTHVIKSKIISGPTNKTIEVRCIEVHGSNITTVATRCHIDLLKDRPLPPMNITVAKDYPAIFWDIPSYTGSSSSNVLITYNITVSSSTGSSTSFNAASTNSTNFLSTNGFAMDDRTANYTVCITAANCIGVSEPSCIKFQVLRPSSSPPAAPVIKKASIVNKALKETVVSLELQLPSNQSNRTTNNYTQEYQVEMVDLKITESLHLDSQNKILVNVPNSLKQTTFRVRTISQEGITGNWSDAVCLKFKIPEISLKPAVDINGTLRLELTIKPDNIDAMPAGKEGVAKCSLPFISKVDIIVENRNGSIFNKSNVFNKINEVAKFNITNITNSLNELNKITTVLHTVLGDHKQEAYFFYKFQENCTDPPAYSKATSVQDSKILSLLFTVIITFVLILM